MLAACWLLLVGCGGRPALTVTAPSPTGGVADACASLVAGAPAKVAGQGRRRLATPTRYAVAWGDPAIVLRCGVPAPAALTPTSRCFVVDGVGWLATQHGAEVDPTGPLTGDLSFVTIGRSAYVEVDVPGQYQPAADALVDLSGTVKGHTLAVRPCR